MAAKKKKNTSTKKTARARKQARPKPAGKGAKTARKPTKKAVAKRTKKAGPKPTKKAVAKPSKKAVAKPAKSLAAKPAKSLAAKPAKSLAAKPAKSLVAKPAKKLPPRRDATGHLDPKYAAKLRQLSRESHDDPGNDRAFFSKARTKDDLAEELGEEAVATMTAGEDQSERLFDLEVTEEMGGPFVRTTGREEYARGTDKSNPRSATREPFPKT